MAAKGVDWKAVFRPTIGKVIVSVLVPALYWYFTYKNIMCTPCLELIPAGSWPNLASSCGCMVGATFPQFLFDAFRIFVIPFAIVYIIYSLVCYFLVKRFLLKEKR